MALWIYADKTKNNTMVSYKSVIPVQSLKMKNNIVQWNNAKSVQIKLHLICRYTGSLYQVYGHTKTMYVL